MGRPPIASAVADVFHFLRISCSVEQWSEVLLLRMLFKEGVRMDASSLWAGRARLALVMSLSLLGQLSTVHAAGRTEGLAGAERVLREAAAGTDAQASQHRYATLIVMSTVARRITTLDGARPQPDDTALIARYRAAMQQLLREAAGPANCQGEHCPAQQFSRRALEQARSPGFAQKVLRQFSTPAWQQANMAAVFARTGGAAPDAMGSMQDGQPASAATVPSAAPPSTHSAASRPGTTPDIGSPQSGTAGGAQPDAPGATARPKDVDLVDIRLGMSAKEAADALAKRYPSAERTVVKGRLNVAGAGEFTTALLAIDRKPMPNSSPGHVYGELVLVLFSTPPGAPEVIHVGRAVFHARGQPSHRDEWLNALAGKYGRATSDDSRMASWVFDTVRPRDARVSKESLASRCAAGSMLRSVPFADGLGHYVAGLNNRLKDGPSEELQSAALRNEEDLGLCGRNLSVAFSQSGGGPLVDALVFELSDHDRAAGAGRKLEAMRSSAARQEAERESGRARQNRPTL